MLIVLDQFEQWLHARRGEQDTQLVQALRHCDGGRCSAWCWCGMISGWPPVASCRTWKSDLLKATTARWSISSTRCTPARCWPPLAAPTAAARGHC